MTTWITWRRHDHSADYLPEQTTCHSPLPVWLVVAGVWESEEGTDATQDSPNGTSIINLNFETRNKNNLWQIRHD